MMVRVVITALCLALLALPAHAKKHRWLPVSPINRVFDWGREEVSSSEQNATNLDESEMYECVIRNHGWRGFCREWFDPVTGKAFLLFNGGDDGLPRFLWVWHSEEDIKKTFFPEHII